jgi:hypothetical protein
MANKKKQQRKLRAKKESNKIKSARRRKKLIHDKREAREAAKTQRKYRVRQEPIVKSNLTQPTSDSPDVVQSRLANHLNTLNTLQEELNKEDDVRDEINTNFENEGVFDMKTKMEKLQELAKLEQQARELAAKKKVKKGMKGSATVAFTPNK